MKRNAFFFISLTLCLAVFFQKNPAHAACTTGGSNSATCNSGSIGNLNYGILNVYPWFQGFGGDMRLDSGFKDQLPTTLTYASMVPTGGTTPGIIHSGKTTAYFGTGQASLRNWITGASSTGYQEAFSGIIKTSYNYLFSTVKEAGVTPGQLTSKAVGSCTAAPGCSLTNLPPGVWIDDTDSDVYLAGSKFCGDSGQCKDQEKNKKAGDFVILIKGNLHIFGSLITPPAYTLTMTVKGNIFVDGAVGVTPSGVSTATKDLQGLFSTDQSFWINSGGACTAAEKQLNIAGAVVVNAALGSGKLVNKRDFCGNDINYPTFTISERPDLMLNAPSLLQHHTIIWQELTP